MARKRTPKSVRPEKNQDKKSTRDSVRITDISSDPLPPRAKKPHGGVWVDLFRGLTTGAKKLVKGGEKSEAILNSLRATYGRLKRNGELKHTVTIYKAEDGDIVVAVK